MGFGFNATGLKRHTRSSGSTLELNMYSHLVYTPSEGHTLLEYPFVRMFPMRRDRDVWGLETVNRLLKARGKEGGKETLLCLYAVVGQLGGGLVSVIRDISQKRRLYFSILLKDNNSVLPTRYPRVSRH